MKKIALVFIFTVIIGFAYMYKSPIISSQTALIHAENYLLNPQEEWGRSIIFNGLEDIPEENIHVNLSEQQGFWNELTNRMQIDVLHYAIAIATVNNIDLTKAIIEKDKEAAIKYNQSPNLEEFFCSTYSKITILINFYNKDFQNQLK